MAQGVKYWPSKLEGLGSWVHGTHVKTGCGGGSRQANPGVSLASHGSLDGEPPGSDSQDKVGGAGGEGS